MSANAAGEVVGRFYDEFGAGDIDAALSVCADDLEIIDPGMGQVRGRALGTSQQARTDARAGKHSPRGRRARDDSSWARAGPRHAPV